MGNLFDSHIVSLRSNIYVYISKYCYELWIYTVFQGLEESSLNMQPYFEEMVNLICRFGKTKYNESFTTMFSDAKGTKLANNKNYDINVLDNINTP